MRAILGTLSIAAGLAWAQTTLTPPQAGFIQDSADSLRPVYGIAGNFLLGDAMVAGVVSAAYSGWYGLIKTGSALVVIDGTGSITATHDAPEGPALFAFARNGEPALVYLPSANALLVWNAGSFEVAPLDPATLGAGVVLSIASPDPRHAAMIVQRDDDGLWDVRIQLAAGAVDAQTALPGAAPPVLMLATGDLLYTDANGVVIRKPDGSERFVAVPLRDTFTLHQMGDGWIQLRDSAAGQQFTIRITENRERFYQLPEVDQ